jgi:small subunit ribosomal protein S8
MMTDPIADMLTRIRNAYLVRKNEIILPYSKLKMNIADILVREGCLSKAEHAQGKPPHIVLNLKYNGRTPSVTEIKRVSRPGARRYAQKDAIQKVLNGYGFSILSTSKGLMTDKEAREAKIGGEVLCEIY